MANLDDVQEFCQFNGVKQWEADPGQKLTGYEKDILFCRYKAVVACGNLPPLRVWFQSLETTVDAGVVFEYAIVDTSETAEGAVTKQRLTFYRAIEAHNCHVMIFPFEPQDWLDQRDAAAGRDE